MGLEIERKFLVDRERWSAVTPEKSIAVKQGYLLSEPAKTIRVRVKGDKGYITIKGKTTGASRPEYEYEIPVRDAEELIRAFATGIIEKTRHLVTHAGKLWEVDEFSGENAGLFVAEIELTSEQEELSKPVWIREEVTSDMRYSNSNLAITPFSRW